MKKTCNICGKKWNDWFVRFLGFIFKDTHEFSSCQTCRDLYASGYNLDQIRRLAKEAVE